MKLPIAYSLSNRQASLDKDALIKNGLAEPDEATKVIRVKKRPALDRAYTAASGTGQALFTWNIPGALGPTETLVSVTNNIINTSPTPVNRRLRFTVNPS